MEIKDVKKYLHSHSFTFDGFSHDLSFSTTFCHFLLSACAVRRHINKFEGH